MDVSLIAMIDVKVVTYLGYYSSTSVVCHLRVKTIGLRIGHMESKQSTGSCLSSATLNQLRTDTSPGRSH